MKTIKQFYLFGALVLLIVIRPFAPGEWFGSVVVSGVFVAWIDLIKKVVKSNSDLSSKDTKDKFGIVMSIMSIAGFVLLALSVINVISTISWMNESLVLDEFTLVALFICVAQDTILDFINWVIRKDGQKG